MDFRSHILEAKTYHISEEERFLWRNVVNIFNTYGTGKQNDVISIRELYIKFKNIGRICTGILFLFDFRHASFSNFIKM